VAVVGGGAAGLTAAYFAAKSGAKVLLMEKNDEPGKKILISGGQRCNVLPLSVDIASDFFTESPPSALRSIFSRWSLEECRDWITEDVGISLALEEETAKYFPVSNSAAEVRDKLLAACRAEGVKITMPAALKDIYKIDEDGPWECIFSSRVSGEGRVQATRVVLATGGKSFPSLGTVGLGYDILKGLGHNLHAPYPALTPLLGTHPGGGTALPGVSLSNCQLLVQGGGHTTELLPSSKKKAPRKQASVSRRTAMLLTHRGFSGPAVLDVSHNYVMAMERGSPVPRMVVAWLRDISREEWERLLMGGSSSSSGASLVSSILRHAGLPSRFADALCVEAKIPGTRKLSELRRDERLALLDVLSGFALRVTGHEGYPKAEVTGGGVPLNELNCSTMESRLAPGMHVCGELLDCHGRIGGFNFYWAWVSGRLAGLGAASSVARPI